jgi:hypothetical protein
MRGDPEMRRVHFNIMDRAAVIPVELNIGGRYTAIIAAIFVLLGGLGGDGYQASRILTTGLSEGLLTLGAFFGGAVVAPLLLPFLPGRAFSWKGMLAGVMVIAILWYLMYGLPGSPGVIGLVSWLLMGGAMASYAALNFTGASTYTSLSGVKQEMRYAVPCLAVAGLAGVVLWAVARFS